MNLILAIKITRLKSKARKLYKRYHIISENYDCGVSVSEFINPELSKINRELSIVMEQLKILDPEFSGITM